MKRVNEFSLTTVLLTVICFVVCLALPLSQAMAADEKQDKQEIKKPGEEIAPVLYVDAVTGKLTAKKPAHYTKTIKLSESVRNAMSRFTGDLKLQESPVPGGGEFVRMKGRFRSVMMQYTDAQGNVHTACKNNQGIVAEHSAEEEK